MEHTELEVKVAEIDQRSKSNTHRLDELGGKYDVLNRLATAVEVLATKAGQHGKEHQWAHREGGHAGERTPQAVGGAGGEKHLSGRGGNGGLCAGKGGDCGMINFKRAEISSC